MLSRRAESLPSENNKERLLEDMAAADNLFLYPKQYEEHVHWDTQRYCLLLPYLSADALCITRQSLSERALPTKEQHISS